MTEENKQSFTLNEPKAASENGGALSGEGTPVLANLLGADAAPSLTELLGPKPDKNAFENMERKRTRLAKIFAGATVVLALMVFGFFYTQLDPNFTLFSGALGPNVAVKFSSSNSELQAKQTALNSLRYRMANLWINELSAEIDAFQKAIGVYNSDFSTNEQKQMADAELLIAETGIKNSLKKFQDILKEPLGVYTYSREPVAPQQSEDLYWTLLKDSLNRERAAAAGDAKPNREAIRMIDNILRLVSDRAFWDTVRAADFSKMSRQDLSLLLTKIRGEGTDELSIIDKIRVKRLNWGKMIRDIHAVIMRKADPLYGQGLFKTIGGFMFSSYRVDSKTGRIGISGVTKRSDTQIFSAIAELVDDIEKSRYFKDIDFRSFAKTREENGDYSSAVNLEFSLQTGDDSRDDLTPST